MLDDLRRSVDDNDQLQIEEEEFEEEAVSINKTPDTPNKLFLGMTPVERMFLSMFLFLNVAILGIALLAATGRIG